MGRNANTSAILCDDYHDRTQYGNGIYRIDHDVYPVVDRR